LRAMMSWLPSNEKGAKKATEKAKGEPVNA
jgi:hypothetical protein